MNLDSETLLAAINQPMPFGKYKGRKLLELPEPYLVWFHQQGFPDGKLGTGDDLRDKAQWPGRHAETLAAGAQIGPIGKRAIPDTKIPWKKPSLPTASCDHRGHLLFPRSDPAANN